MMACPKCKKALERNSAGLFCQNCHSLYNDIDGIHKLLEDTKSGSNFFTEHVLSDVTAYQEGHFWYNARREIIEKLLGIYVPKQAGIIEMGCGNGNVATYLKKAGWKVDCADLYLSGLRNCKLRSNGGEYYQINLMDPVFFDEYDCVCAFDVIEHIDDDVSVIGNMRQALKDDGILFLTVPANMYLWSQNDVNVKHKRRYNKAELVSKVSSSGFEVLKASYFNTLLFPPIVFYRLVSKMTGRDSKSTGVASQIKIISPFNGILYQIFSQESSLLTRANMPYGNSLLCIARKNSSGH